MNTEIIKKIEEIENFVLSIKSDAMKMKGVDSNGHTYLIGKDINSSVLIHEKYSVILYFNQSYFVVEISFCDKKFSASVRNSRGGYEVSILGDYIKTYLCHTGEIKEAWDIAKGIDNMSIIEKQILSKKNRISYLKGEITNIEEELKKLECENN